MSKVTRFLNEHGILAIPLSILVICMAMPKSSGAYVALLMPLSIFSIGVIGFVRIRAWRQSGFLQRYSFPFVLHHKLRERHPKLSDSEIHQVLEGLRQFFFVCQLGSAVSKGVSFGMPSKVVDDAWHEFILMSREYTRFCDRAFGRYLHHTPAALSEESVKMGLWRTAYYLQTSSPNPAWATLYGLPLIFALDRVLSVEGGYFYDVDTFAALRPPPVKATDTDDALAYGAGVSFSSDGDGGGCGGDGGGGCGGGCGGG